MRPLTFFAGVMASRLPALRGFRRLTVYHGGRRTGLASDALAHEQYLFEAFSQARIAEGREPSMGRLMRREMLRRDSPGATLTQQIENRVHHFAQRPAPRAAGRGGRRRKRLEKPPFFVCQTAVLYDTSTVIHLAHFGRPYRGYLGKGVHYQTLSIFRITRPHGEFRDRLQVRQAAKAVGSAFRKRSRSDREIIEQMRASGALSEE